MSRYYLALDVGGTKVAAGVVSAAGEVLSHLRTRTADLRAGGDPLTALIALGREALAAAGNPVPAAVGAALPGPVAHAELRMLSAPTLPEFENVPLAAPLQAAFGCPAAGDNDANGCALAESRFGAGKGAARVVYFTVSTGIGGGIVLDGRVYRGARGTSAEFGHQVIQPLGGPLCDCGNTGCLEVLASGRGIARRAREAFQDPALTADAVAEAARRGDPTARRVWEETALYLGLGVSNVINIVDPDVVVLGGGVGVGAADLLLEPVRQVVRQRCMPSLSRDTPILRAALGEELGLVSAAALALEAFA